MTTPLINPIHIELKVKTPVAMLRAHFSTAIETSMEWFSWKDVEYDKNGDPVKATLTYWDQGNEDRLRTREFTDRDFASGLQAYVTVHGLTSIVQYNGDGEWDIDADGADCIVQYAVYEELLLS